MSVLFLIFSAWILISPSIAEAYLDPGSGSLFLQVLLAGFAGAGVLLKLYWHKLTSIFTGSSKQKKTDLSKAEKDDEAPISSD